MFAALLEFAIRHTVYREDGAAYGFCQVPQAGAALTVVGLVLIGLAQPAAVAPRVEHSAGQCEA
jgi:hypothetical protein